MKRSYINYILVLFVLLSGCQRDSFIEPIEHPAQEPFEEIYKESSVIGFVEDELGQPLPGVTVTLEDQISRTDQNGVFVFRDIYLLNAGADVSFSKEGYSPTSRKVFSNFGTLCYVKVALETRKNPTVSFNSNIVNTINIDEVELTIPANAINVKGGSAYNGQVYYLAEFIKPFEDSFAKKYANNLLAKDAINNYKILTSNGILSFNICGASGEVLELKEHAKILVKIPILFLNAKVEMWDWDASEKIWKDEKNMTANGDFWIIELEEFGEWNCAISHPASLIRGSVSSADNHPLAFQSLSLLSNNLPIGQTYSHKDGRFNIWVPKGQQLQIEIKDFCGATNEVFDFNSFNEGIDQDFVLSNHTHSLVKGEMVDCNYRPVRNRYVLIESASFQFISITNNEGIFQDNITYCSDNPFTIRPYNLPKDEITFYTVLEIQEGDNNLGEVSSCLFGL